MSKTYQILRQATLIGTQVEDLRSAVGWDRMQGKYDQILAQSYAHFSVFDNSRLIGFVNVISDGVADAFLVDFMVHPDFQRRGIGKALITHVIKSLKADGLRFIQVIFGAELESFYRECGFHIVRAGIIDSEFNKAPEVISTQQS
ncbi:MAG TPA: GNAT family N-acetyltransferase [Anaerolineae bacterium]|nr:GNAT family N-acetyltransferase [Anaerolineae bacterium]